MNIPSIKLRYINYACYEIILPNGKEIVIDPCINYKEPDLKFTRDDFSGADYILLSHTHYDHTMDLSYLANKFNSKVFIGQMSMMADLQFDDINLDNVYPVSPMETFEMPDFRLEVFRGKHTFMNNPNNTVSKRIGNQNQYFPVGHNMADIWGSMEYMDYMITTNENIRIFLNGGGPNKFFYNNIAESMKKASPNIIFRQSSSKYTPEEYAQTVASYHAQLVFPLHQDGIERKTNMTVQDYVDRANDEFLKINSFTRMINPKKYEWYEVSMTAVKANKL